MLLVMCASVALGLVILAWPEPCVTQRLLAVSMRSSALQGRGAKPGCGIDLLPETGRSSAPSSHAGPSGIAPAISAMCASMRAGMSVEQAVMGRTSDPPDGFADLGASRPDRIRSMLAEHALPRERNGHVAQAAVDIAAACRVSETLGCSAVRCLEAVGASYRRARLLADLRAQAFAVPQATVKLLLGLPVLTALFGELLGASPFAFLFGSMQGLMCLGLGLCCYAGGLVWIRALMRDMSTV